MAMQKFTLTLMLLLGLSHLTLAQMAFEPPYIEVQTQSEREIIPNEIFVKIVLSEQAESKKSVKISEQESRLFKMLRNLNLKTEDLVLNQSEAKLAHIHYWGKKEPVDKKQYTLKISNVQTLNKVYEELNAIPVREAYVVKTQIQNKDSVLRILRLEALQKAKIQGQEMLAVFGQNIGKPFIIREQIEYPVVYADRAMNMKEEFEESEESSAVPESPLNFAPTKISVGVYVKFEIK
jgi:uncharacterized protein